MRLPILSSKKRWLDLGTEVRSERRVDFSLARLNTHMHIIGPPDSGKTRLLFSLFQQLVRSRDATVILFNVKGDLGTMARDWCIGRGYTKRLLWFDPADEEQIIGYNPLRPNGLTVATQAKNVREAIRSAWGQTSFDQTAQLARFLYLTLFVVRELNFTLSEALSLLRPGSETRRAMLPAIADPYIREEFEYLDSLRGSRHDDLVAPTLARLESLVLDPGIRRIITQQAHSLDLADVLRNKQILIVNFEQYKPLTLDDVKLLGRFIINDVVNHVFQRPKAERTPVYLLLDECQTVATADLCRALDQGRELGLHCVLANQYLEQLRQEETSGLLYYSVMECVRSKILFGGLSTRELELLTPEVMLDRYDPWRIKDELTTLECEPVESTRVVSSEGESLTVESNESNATMHSTSYTRTQGRESSRGQAVGVSSQRGFSRSKAITRSLARGTSSTYGHSTTRGHATTVGQGSTTSAQEGTGQTSGPDGDGFLNFQSPEVLFTSEYSGTGRSDSNFNSETDSASETDDYSETETLTSAKARTTTRGVQRSFGRSRTFSKSAAKSLTKAEGNQDGTTHTQGRGISSGRNRARSVVPWIEYRKRRIVSSRQFLSKEEQMTLALQEIQSQPKGHFLIKVTNHPAVFVRSAFVKTPWISRRKLEAGLERIYEGANYATNAAIAIEEQDRTRRLEELAYGKKAEPDLISSESTAKLATEKQSKAASKPRKKATAQPKTTPFDSVDFDDDDVIGRE